MEKKQHPVYQAIRAAFPHTIPVLTGYLVLGVAYGVLMQTKGYGTPWALRNALILSSHSIPALSPP